MRLKKSLKSDTTTSRWGNIERTVREQHMGHFNNPYYTIYNDETIKSSIIKEATDILKGELRTVRRRHR